MVGRSYASSEQYRFCFNGKEDDKETGWQNYGFRMYNPVLARFFRVDPIAKDYPELTPYQFASNTPICAIDLDGLEAVIYIHSPWYKNQILAALALKTEEGNREAWRLVERTLHDQGKTPEQKKILKSHGSLNGEAASVKFFGDSKDIVVAFGKRPMGMYKTSPSTTTFDPNSTDEERMTWLQKVVNEAYNFEKKSGTDPEGGGHGKNPEVKDPKGLGKTSDPDSTAVSEVYEKTTDSAVYYERGVPHKGPIMKSQDSWFTELDPSVGTGPVLNKDDSIKYKNQLKK